MYTLHESYAVKVTVIKQSHVEIMGNNLHIISGDDAEGSQDEEEVIPQEYYEYLEMKKLLQLSSNAAMQVENYHKANFGYNLQYEESINDISHPSQLLEIPNDSSLQSRETSEAEDSHRTLKCSQNDSILLESEIFDSHNKSTSNRSSIEEAPSVDQRATYRDAILSKVIDIRSKNDIIFTDSNQNILTEDEVSNLYKKYSSLADGAISSASRHIDNKTSSRSDEKSATKSNHYKNHDGRSNKQFEGSIVLTADASLRENTNNSHVSFKRLIDTPRDILYQEVPHLENNSSAMMVEPLSIENSNSLQGNLKGQEVGDRAHFNLDGNTLVEHGLGNFIPLPLVNNSELDKTNTNIYEVRNASNYENLVKCIDVEKQLPSQNSYRKSRKRKYLSQEQKDTEYISSLDNAHVDFSGSNERWREFETESNSSAPQTDEMSDTSDHNDESNQFALTYFNYQDPEENCYHMATLSGGNLDNGNHEGLQLEQGVGITFEGDDIYFEDPGDPSLDFCNKMRQSNRRSYRIHNSRRTHENITKSNDARRMDTVQRRSYERHKHRSTHSHILHVEDYRARKARLAKRYRYVKSQQRSLPKSGNTTSSKARGNDSGPHHTIEQSNLTYTDVTTSSSNSAHDDNYFQMQPEGLDEDMNDEMYWNYNDADHTNLLENIVTGKIDWSGARACHIPEIIDLVTSSMRIRGSTRDHYVGKTFLKNFNGTWHKGTVVHYDYLSKWFHVIYDDDDQEDLGQFELDMLLKRDLNRYPLRNQSMDMPTWEKPLSDICPMEENEFVSMSSDEDSDPDYVRIVNGPKTNDKVSLQVQAPRRKKSYIPIKSLSYIGRKVKKFFGDEEFDGEVADYDMELKAYLIRYDDGDAEHVEISELKEILVSDGSTKENRTKSKTRVKSQKVYTPPPWQIQGGETDDSRLKIASIEIENTTNDDRCFFRELFSHGRILLMWQPVTSTLVKLPNCYFFEGKNYSVVSVKKQNDGRNFVFNSRKYKLEYMYIAESGLGLEPISLKEKLQRVADFAAIKNVNKIASRLELMQSTAIKTCPPQHLTVDDFEVIDENFSDVTNESMGDGCGFISCEMLARLLKKSIDKVLAVQVRIFGPKLGIWKGMLCRKPNIDKIQLVQSMQKVKKATFPDPEDWVCMVVVHAMPSSTNVAFERYLMTGKFSDSLRVNSMSRMTKRLLKCLGVSEGSIDELDEKGFMGDRAFLVGLADPTNLIPEGKVFITGFKCIRNRPGFNVSDKIFLTRSPSVKPTDGRLVSVIMDKPENMPLKTWHWLNSLPWGGLIFSTAGKGVPIPMACASGDVDGDLYFACWDHQIVQQIKPAPLPNFSKRKSVTSEPASATDTVHSAQELPEGVTDAIEVTEENWLDLVQEHILNTDVNYGLVGRIYKEMEKIQDSTREGLYHPDALAYADAYLQSLDQMKHGGNINLPGHLRKAVGL